MPGAFDSRVDVPLHGQRTVSVHLRRKKLDQSLVPQTVKKGVDVRAFYAHRLCNRGGVGAAPLSQENVNPCLVSTQAQPDKYLRDRVDIQSHLTPERRVWHVMGNKSIFVV